jgi:23S rRNA (adenine2030-N6)-methyltransferase
MNYRHSFHAGSFADVVKHAVLVRILVHLRTKPAPFRVIDTHAGAGRYDLAGPEALRSPEWRDGIGRLLRAFSGKVEPGFPQKMRPLTDSNAPIAEGARALLAPYLEAVAALNSGGRLLSYPGSPALVQAFLRAQDRLVACELEPNAAAALARRLHGDRRSKAVAIDGWTALNAYVPPKERRGLVLIDPPFEDPDDFPRLALALEAAHRKWAGGTYLLWYPIKERAAPDALARRLRRSGIAKILRAELSVHRSRVSPRSALDTSDTNRLLDTCALVVVNPPWTLAAELALLLPELAAVLADDGRGASGVDWLAGEK